MTHYQRFVLIYVVLLLAPGVNAQNDFSCGTTPEEQHTTFSFVNTNPAYSPPVNGFIVSEVPVQFHIIGANNGALAIDSTEVFEELAKVNEVFAAIDIEFVHCGSVNFINNNSYLSFTKGTDEVLCDIHDVPNVINIYFAPNLENTAGESLCGYAYNFDIQNRVFMDNGCATNGSTLIHELGHSFSLLHTHSTFNGTEVADGSNCAFAGDLLCDTPADPRLNNAIVNENCEYTGVETDPLGNSYTPDTGNLMSYSRKDCRDHFSEQQLAQMMAFYQFEGGFLGCSAGPVSTNTPFTNKLTIYPNPSDDLLQLEGLTFPSTLLLIDLNGRVQWQYHHTDGSSSITVPAFQQLPAGLYTLLVKTSTGLATAHRVVRL
jgi:hypothetical protein